MGFVRGTKNKLKYPHLNKIKWIFRDNLWLNWKNSFNCTIFTKIMGLFSRKKEIIIGNVCPKCNMEFSDSQKTLRHIKKAHKSKKKFNCDSCGFNN
jgi:uncharacterized C2H2 Zn-finger protein